MELVSYIALCMYITLSTSLVYFVIILLIITFTLRVLITHTFWQCSTNFANKITLAESNSDNCRKQNLYVLKGD